MADPLSSTARARVEEYRPLVEFYFRPNHVEYALIMMGWESAGIWDNYPKLPGGIPRSSARGLFQHLARLWAGGRALWVKNYFTSVNINLPLTPCSKPVGGWVFTTKNTCPSVYNTEFNIAAAAWLLDHSGRDPKWGGWGQWTSSHPSSRAPEKYGTPRFGDPGLVFPYDGYSGHYPGKYRGGSVPLPPPVDQPQLPLEEEMSLKNGDEGKAVVYYQESLMRWNPDALPGWGADGDFGPETRDWVKRFQASYDLSQTGIIDGVTADLLGNF